MRSRLALTVRAAVVLALVSGAGASSLEPRASLWADPIADRTPYVDPDSPAHRAHVDAPDDAGAAVLAAVPQARWFTDAIPATDVAARVAAYVAGAAAAAKLPVLVVYAIPGRDCGGYSAGGLPDAAAYGDWIRRFRSGLGERAAAVVLEPDALTGADCLPPAAQTARYAMLADAVSQLRADTSTVLYVDGGHSRWLSPTELARRLRLVGAPGFALDVSNFFTTGEEQEYGERVSALLGGAHYIVDTSRNGRGPAPDAPLNWCNPTGRAVGAAPTTATAAPHDDADLWIKNPGQSDGDCGRGDPTSGVWFSERADEMVQLAAAAPG